MPRKELQYPNQIEDWLNSWGIQLQEISKEGSLILIGSAGLLWHAYQQQIVSGLPEQSMDADPITTDDCVAEMGYDSCIGSEFETSRGWHINMLPEEVLTKFPIDWTEHKLTKQYGPLTVHVPCVAHLLIPKIRRGEPRDLVHYQWARDSGLIESKSPEILGLLETALMEHAEKLRLRQI